MRGTVPTIHCDDEAGCTEWLVDYYELGVSNWREFMDEDWIFDPYKDRDRAFCAVHAASQTCGISPAPGTPQNPVNGATHPCPTPGYAGRHTAVGAGAISSPYVCHGCSTWFVLPEEPRPISPGEGA